VLAELDDDALLSNDNPMGILLYAAKNAMHAKAEHRKYRYLRIAMDRLAERGWDRKDKHDLMLFIERIVNLQDEELIAQYNEHRLRLDKEGKIMYIQLLERERAEELIQSGVEKGKLEGRLEGKLEVARNLLARGDSPDTVSKIAGLPKKKIQELMN
jgi:predicted transposase/invertase (TIGR01784 family)